MSLTVSEKGRPMARYRQTRLIRDLSPGKTGHAVAWSEADAPPGWPDGWRPVGEGTVYYRSRPARMGLGC